MHNNSHLLWTSYIRTKQGALYKTGGLYRTPNLCYSKCGHQTSSVSLTWELKLHCTPPGSDHLLHKHQKFEKCCSKPHYLHNRQEKNEVQLDLITNQSHRAGQWKRLSVTPWGAWLCAYTSATAPQAISSLCPLNITCRLAAAFASQADGKLHGPWLWMSCNSVLL